MNNWKRLVVAVAAVALVATFATPVAAQGGEICGEISITFFGYYIPLVVSECEQETAVWCLIYFGEESDGWGCFEYDV